MASEFTIMTDHYGNPMGSPPPYSTNPPQHDNFPQGGHGYYSGGYAAPPPQPAPSAPPITPQPSVQRSSAAPVQSQAQAQPANRGRGQKNKQQQRAQAQQQQSRPKMKRTNSGPSEISLCTKYALFFANFIFWVSINHHQSFTL